MRNVFKFILRFYHVFLFLILQLICISLIVNYNPYQGSIFYNATNHVTGNLYGLAFNVKEYFHLQKVNDSLMAENARLRAMIPSSYYHAGHLEVHVEDTLIKQKFTYIPANVINNSIERSSNYLTINKGNRHGIDGKMGVITPTGIAGIITRSGTNFSTAISVIHRDFNISARVVEINEIGSLEWDGKNPRIVTLKDIPLQAHVKEGQAVVVSPHSMLFPEGHPIGKIVAVKEGLNPHFYNIFVELNEDLRNITKVNVVINLMKKEQLMLEEHSLQ